MRYRHEDPTTSLMRHGDWPARRHPPNPKGMPAPSASAIIVPISATRQVTIQRVGIINTSSGTTWRGKITESGENALLM